MANPKHRITMLLKVGGFSTIKQDKYSWFRTPSEQERLDAYTFGSLEADAVYYFTLSNKLIGLLKAQGRKVVARIAGGAFKVFRSKIPNPEHWSSSKLSVAFCHDNEVLSVAQYAGIDSVVPEFRHDTKAREGYIQTYYRNVHRLKDFFSVQLIDVGTTSLRMLEDSRSPRKNEGSSGTLYHNHGGKGTIYMPYEGNRDMMHVDIKMDDVTLKRFRGSILERSITQMFTEEAGGIEFFIKEWVHDTTRSQFFECIQEQVYRLSKLDGRPITIDITKGGTSGKLVWDKTAEPTIRTTRPTSTF